MDYHSHRFHDHSLMLFHQDKLVGLVPGNSVGNKWFSHQGLSYGGLFSNKNSQLFINEMIGCLIEYFREHSFVELSIKPMPDIYYPSGFSKALSFALFFHGFQLVSKEPSTTLSLNNLNKYYKGRSSSIRRAMRDERLKINRDYCFGDFIELENARLLEKYNTLAVHNMQELTFLANSFPSNIHLYTVKTSSILLAGAVIFIVGEVMHLQYFSTNELGRKLAAGDLLIDYCIHKARRLGLSSFDFGISTEKKGSIVNAGLIKYKESFGGVTSVIDSYIFRYS